MTGEIVISLLGCFQRVEGTALTRGYFAGCLTGLLLLSSFAWAWQLDGELAYFQGQGWRAEGIRTTLAYHPDQASLSVALAHLQLPLGFPALDDVHVICETLQQDETWLGCEAAELRVAGGRQATLGFRYRRQDGALWLQLDGLDFAPGMLDVLAESDATGWRVDIAARAFPAARLNRILREVFTTPFASASGSVDLDLELQGGEAGLQNLSMRLHSRALSFTSADGLQAAEDLQGELSGSWHFSDGDFRANLRLDAGQLYWDPVFVQPDPTTDPIELRVVGHWQSPRLRLDEWYLRHPNVIRAEGQLGLNNGRLSSAQVEVIGASVEGLYNTYLRPIFGAGHWPALSATGYIKGALLVREGALTALETSFLNIGLSLQNRAFALENLTGWLDWRADGSPQDIQINWISAYLYDIPLGALKLSAQSRGSQVQLLTPVRLPVLDGALVLERLSGQLNPLFLSLDGRLEPLSLAQFSERLGWPVLPGTVAGVVPGMSYRPGLLEVGGEILVEVFDGAIQIQQLRLQEPLGPTPRLLADLYLEQLDLGRITQVFDIGAIQGRLGGYVQDLLLENWQPQRFDALLATPPQNPGTRLISQRAVETLSSVGGAGASAALSRGVLGMFDEFRYQRLGIRCRLQAGVCQMDGVAPAGQDSYYLVEGGGLPRIDVIGYTRRVDWRDLLQRLQAAAQSGAPEIR